MIDTETIFVNGVMDEQKSGQKVGMPNSWIIVTHIPTQTQIRLYTAGSSQHRTREKAMALLELAIDGMEGAQCHNPEAVEDMI